MVKPRFRITPYCLYQSLSSIAFVLLVAHTQEYQQLHWPEGRVVYVHPWLLVAAYGTGAVALFLGLWGLAQARVIGRLERWLPQLAWGLIGIMILMAVLLPGPYLP